MWIFTTHGFFTAVENRDDPNMLIVRCRVREDMNNIRRRYFPTLSKTTFHNDFDYPYRANITKLEYAKGMARTVMDIEYERFKPAVQGVQGKKRADMYTGLWWKIIELERDPKRIDNYFYKDKKKYATKK